MAGFTARVAGWRGAAGAGGQVPVSAGNPVVEELRGRLQLFRDVREGDPEAEQLPAGVPPARGRRVCVVEVPARVPAAELCQFLGAFLSRVHRMRLVRNDAAPGTYAALLDFDDAEPAGEFFSCFDGRPFSSLEPEICRVVYVTDLELVPVAGAGAGASSALSEEIGVDPGAPPAGQTEMPNCAVCLERLDPHISGLVTTVCNHQFHQECLGKVRQASCPVCRYCQEDEQAAAALPQCADCGTEKDLWVCLICGYLGCGRYKGGHAADHFRESGHSYSLELASHRVWDYVGDSYVHRLVRSKADGHLVEVPSPASAAFRYGGSGAGGGASSSQGPRPAGGGGTGGAKKEDRGEPGLDGEEAFDSEMRGALLSSKIEAVSAEYSDLLATQLDSQREHFEGRLAEAQGSGAEAVAAAEALREQAGAMKGEAAAQGEAARRAARKLARAEAELAKLRQEADFLKQLNQALMANERDHRERLREQERMHQRGLEARDAEAADMQEQLRDVMLALEAQQLLRGEGAAAEASGGTVLGVQQRDSGGSGGGVGEGRDPTHGRLRARAARRHQR